jgi:imipenem/basic amino acid-specific outer membrane pore
MKLGKLSLVAVMALGTSAYAVENVKFNGEVKAIYQTSDVELQGSTASTGMFDNGNGVALPVSPYNGASAGGFSATLGVTADLLNSVKGGAEAQFYSSLGSGIFNDSMINADYGSTGFTRAMEDRLDDAANISQFWLSADFDKTNAKIGRMEIDTPLLFTEKWNIAKNTFDALVFTNTDLPQTTLVGAFVGRHNGHGNFVTASGIAAIGEDGCTCTNEGGVLLAGSPGRTVTMNSFRKLYTEGAYTAGAINKSIPGTTLQAWYYAIPETATAAWLQADTKVGMVNLGAQYATMKADKDLVSNLAAASVTLNENRSSIVAIKAAMDVSGVNLYAAYSKADKDGQLGFSNVSTADKTKIYTGDGSIYFDGVVTAPGVDTYKVGASGAVGSVKLSAFYVNANDMYDKTIDGFNVTASTSVGKLGLMAMYEQVNNDQASKRPNGTTNNTPAFVGQPFYMGRDIDTLRLIASLKF